MPLCGKKRGGDFCGFAARKKKFKVYFCTVLCPIGRSSVCFLLYFYPLPPVFSHYLRVILSGLGIFYLFRKKLSTPPRNTLYPLIDKALPSLFHPFALFAHPLCSQSFRRVGEGTEQTEKQPPKQSKRRRRKPKRKQKQQNTQETRKQAPRKDKNKPVNN